MGLGEDAMDGVALAGGILLVIIFIAGPICIGIGLAVWAITGVGGYGVIAFGISFFISIFVVAGIMAHTWHESVEEEA